MENNEVIIEKKNHFSEDHPALFAGALGGAAIIASVGLCLGGYWIIGKVIGKGLKGGMSEK